MAINNSLMMISEQTKASIMHGTFEHYKDWNKQTSKRYQDNTIVQSIMHLSISIAVGKHKVALESETQNKKYRIW
jgi:hypothetical protein